MKIATSSSDAVSKSRLLPSFCSDVGGHVHGSVVASSLRNFGEGLFASQDEIGWVQRAYLIAEIFIIPLSSWLTWVFSTRWLFVRFGMRLYRCQHVVRHCLEHRNYRFPRPSGPVGRVDDPHVSRGCSALARHGYRYHRLDCSSTGPDNWGLDH